MSDTSVVNDLDEAALRTDEQGRFVIEQPPPSRPDRLEPRRRYLVTVHYTEPTFDLQRGRDAIERTCTYVVYAHQKNTAVELARQAFRDLARRSSVGWVRRILRVTLGG